MEQQERPLTWGPLVELPGAGAGHRAGCDGTCSSRVGALPPSMALFPSGNGDANSSTQFACSVFCLLTSKAKASLTPHTTSVCTGFTGGDSCSRAAGFRQPSSGGRQSSSQVSICSFVVFVRGGGENRVIH